MFIVAAASLAACNSNQQQSATEETTKESAVAVKTCTAEVMTIDLKETYTSEILPYKENDITPAAQGLHIDQIRFDVGDRVKEGEVLATLNRSSLKQLEINLATVEDSYNRMKPVHEAGGISDQQFIELENTLNLQKEMVYPSPLLFSQNLNFLRASLFAHMSPAQLTGDLRRKIRWNLDDKV